MKEIYNCLILNDYPEKHYASNLAAKLKTIETRTREFKYGGALCVVNYYDCIGMTQDHEKEAMIAVFPKAKAMLLKDWRYFNRKFSFAKRRVSGTFQGIFQITLPDDVFILKGEDEKVSEFHNHGAY